ncbi:hypothetical protein [Burkholderia sp. ABCPW 14]|uniref:hypothetical protein n=1 Tax=Burkholderia sp. ABCPW 14 TaxID=1637860 RepID=UPI000A685BB8|nr:hypothetical protein [Burkholderia sp. ABCPW 14]
MPARLAAHRERQFEVVVRAQKSCRYERDFVARRSSLFAGIAALSLTSLRGSRNAFVDRGWGHYRCGSASASHAIALDENLAVMNYSTPP